MSRGLFRFSSRPDPVDDSQDIDCWVVMISVAILHYLPHNAEVTFFESEEACFINFQLKSRSCPRKHDDMNAGQVVGSVHHVS